MKLSTLLLLIFTLIAFAANSILCRLALISGSIGAIEFTSLRLGSAMIVLLPVILLHKRQIQAEPSESFNASDQSNFRLTDIWPAMALFGYALFFSLAYVQLEAGMGALILFAAVQITMIGISIAQGNKVSLMEWAGIVISISGLVYLLSPGLSSPPVLGAIMMIFSGFGWGIYSLLGKNQVRPVFSTARNFLFCLPGVIILVVIASSNWIYQGHVQINAEGIILAVISGAVASGLGYILWYMTMRRLTTTAASVSQLVVPVLAAVGGIIFLSESPSWRLAVAAVLIIGGITITIAGGKTIKS